MINLDDRLKSVAGFVVGDSACDIGCDHGKLCGYLLQNSIVKKAIGVDISEKSLGKSYILKKECKLDNLELVVANGLDGVKDKKIDTIVMCGIGSNITCEILNANLDVAKNAKRLVLCPLKNTFIVREYLYKNGFEIIKEDLVFEGNRYYNIFVACVGKVSSYDDVDIFVGRKLVGNKLLKPWLNLKIEQMQKNIDRYNSNAKGDYSYKLENMQRMLNAYKKGIELC